MDWLFGHHWTPGWGALLTAVITPLVTLTGVALTIRSQSERYRLERVHQAHAEVRETVADLLAARDPWNTAAEQVRLIALDEPGSGGFADPSAYWEVARERMRDLRRKSSSVTLNCARITLMTKDEHLVAAADSLNKAVTARLQKVASRELHPSRLTTGLDYLAVSAYLIEVDDHFSKLTEVARDRLAVTPDGK